MGNNILWWGPTQKTVIIDPFSTYYWCDGTTIQTSILILFRLCFSIIMCYRSFDNNSMLGYDNLITPPTVVMKNGRFWLPLPCIGGAVPPSRKFASTICFMIVPSLLYWSKATGMIVVDGMSVCSLSTIPHSWHFSERYFNHWSTPIGPSSTTE